MTEFSKKSRRRMMTSLALIDQTRAGLPSFLSPTYPDEALPMSEQRVKRDLAVLRMALERRYGRKAVLWRREYVARKSGTHVGEFAPHLHFLVWGVEPTAADRVWFAETWCRITGASGQPWEQKQFEVASHEKTWFMPDSWRGTLAYVSKYCAKVSEHPACGRAWGYWRRELLPIKMLSDEIPHDSFHAVRRVLRKYLSRKTGRRVRSYWREQGLSAYLSEATGEKLVRWAWDIGWWIPPGEEDG